MKRKLLRFLENLLVSKLDKALSDLLAALNEEPLIIEFNKARNLVTSDEFLLQAEKDLKKLQQGMTRDVLDKTKHDSYKNEYNVLKKAYDEHPYVVNYNSLLNDVNDLLLTLKTIIE